MLQAISIESCLTGQYPLIDVRSPGEYAKGHIPHAINVPLFSDEERAQIGTMYVRQSREQAIAIGYACAEPKKQWYLDEVRRIAGSGPVVIHCWRGGMRSRLFAEHLHENGFSDVSVITGGYKAYRRLVQATFEKKRDIRMIGGYTGSGKTKIMHWLRENGHQVIDLEGLAHHKGSAFGALGQLPQPKTEQFENDVHALLMQFDTHKPLFLEDESINIGSVFIPQPFFKQMRNAPLFFIDIPREIRAHYLTKDYAGIPSEGLIESFQKISKRLGFENTAMAIQCINENNLEGAALIALQYYDKTYMKGLSARDPQLVNKIVSTTTEAMSNAMKILECL